MESRSIGRPVRTARVGMAVGAAVLVAGAPLALGRSAASVRDDPLVRQGHDARWGEAGDDLLQGGSGIDVGDAGPDTDRCLVETSIACE